MRAPLDEHGARLVAFSTRRIDGGPVVTHDDDRQGEVLEAPRTGPNPTETLDYSYEQMLQQLQNVKRGVADVVTSKKRIELQQQKLEQNVVKLQSQARPAVAANREPGAAGSRAQGGSRRQQLQDMDGQVQATRGQAGKLVTAQQQLETRIESFRSQKEILKAQYSAAEAQVKVGEAATGIGQHMNDTGLAIQRAKDKTEEMQARASAIDELTSTGALEDFTAGDQTQLDRELAQISSASQVDDSSRSSRPRSAPARPRRRSPPATRSPHRRRRGRPAASRAGGAAGRGNHRVLTRFGDILFGRKKLQGPAAEKLFALSTAAVTLDTECSLRRPATLRSSSSRSRRGVQLGRERRGGAAARRCADSGSAIERKTDSFGFEWVIVRDPQLEAGRRRPRTGLGARTSRLRRPAARRGLPLRRRRLHSRQPVYWIYGFKTGTWWPFVPTGEKQERDNARGTGAEGETGAGAPGRARPQ